MIGTSLACQYVIYWVGIAPSKLSKSLVDKNAKDFQEKLEHSRKMNKFLDVRHFSQDP